MRKPTAKAPPKTAAQKRHEKAYLAALKALLWVEVLEAKPNPLFTEWQRSTVKFLRYNRHVVCAECGRKRRLHWTMLCDFKCSSMVTGRFTLLDGKKTHLPLTPVCSDHMLQPATPAIPKTK